MKYLVFLSLIVFSPILSLGQFSKYELSEPIDIPTIGWNKLLQMSNGNTMLFHLEPRKAIVVKVFDSTRKEVSSRRHVTKEVKPRDFERSSFDGLFEINGEAILFLSADVDNRETLVRMHFNSMTGSLLHEDKVVVSESFKKRAASFVLCDEKVEGYAVISMKNFKKYIDEKSTERIELYRYDDNHNELKKVVLDFDYKDYDQVRFVGANMGSNGTVNVSLSLTKFIEFPSTFNRYFATCFLSENGSNFDIVTSKINNELRPYYTQYTYNQFDNYHQVFLVNSLNGYYEYGLGVLPVTHYNTLMSIYAPSKLSTSAHKYIENKEAISFYKKNRKNIKKPVELAANKFYSDSYGNTIIISEEHADNLQVEIDNRYFSLLGNISITKVMGNGKESWGVMLPKKQMVPNRLSASTLFYRNRAINIFRRDDPLLEQVNQFASFYSFTDRRALFVMYNDLKENFNRLDSMQVDTLYDCTAADAVYHVIDSKKDETKYMLYDKELDDGTTRAVFIESCVFDKKRKVYATLMLHTIDDKTSEIKISWHYK